MIAGTIALPRLLKLANVMMCQNFVQSNSHLGNNSLACDMTVCLFWFPHYEQGSFASVKLKWKILKTFLKKSISLLRMWTDDAFAICYEGCLQFDGSVANRTTFLIACVAAHGELRVWEHVLLGDRTCDLWVVQRDSDLKPIIGFAVLWMVWPYSQRIRLSPFEYTRAAREDSAAGIKIYQLVMQQQMKFVNYVVRTGGGLSSDEFRQFALTWGDPWPNVS